MSVNKFDMYFEPEDYIMLFFFIHTVQSTSLSLPFPFSLRLNPLVTYPPSHPVPQTHSDMIASAQLRLLRNLSCIISGLNEE